MNKRLLQFITAENISQSQFADNIGVARASVSHIIAGRNKPGFDFVEKMARAFPALNIEWLITGRGKMYKSALGEQPQKPSTNDDYANDLFGDAYRDSLIATTVVQNGNDLLDSAFMDSITPSDAADGSAAVPPAAPAASPSSFPSASPSASSAPQPTAPVGSAGPGRPAGRNYAANQQSPAKQTTNSGNLSQSYNAPFGHPGHSIAKIIVFYDDGTYQELK